MYNIILYYRFWQTLGNYLFIYLAATGIWPFLIAFRLECKNGLNDSSPSFGLIVVFNNKCTLKIIKCIDCLCGACVYVPSLCDFFFSEMCYNFALCVLYSLIFSFFPSIFPFMSPTVNTMHNEENTRHDKLLFKNKLHNSWRLNP